MPVFNQALCRKCGRAYDPNKTRADWRGYCSAACQHQMARDLGYRPGKYVQRPGFSRPLRITEYDVLSRHGAIGDIPAAA
jgi:hypothetical protein